MIAIDAATLAVTTAVTTASSTKSWRRKGREVVLFISDAIPVPLAAAHHPMHSRYLLRGSPDAPSTDANPFDPE